MQVFHHLFSFGLAMDAAISFIISVLLMIDFLRRSVEIRRIIGLKYVNIGFLSCYSLFRPVR